MRGAQRPCQGPLHICCADRPSGRRSAASLGGQLLSLPPFERLALLRSDPRVRSEWQAYVHQHQLQVAEGPPHVQQLIRWCTARHVLVSPFVEIRRTRTAGLGLFARHSIPRHTVLVAVPDTATLVVPQKEVPSENACSAFMRNMDIAALVLLHTASDADNPLHGYVRFLQDNPLPRNAPLLEDWDFKSDCPEVQLHVYFRQLLRSYATTHPVISRFGEDPYCWAISTFLSRATGGAAEHNVLVPILDLINHGGAQANVVPVRPTTTLTDANLMAGVAQDLVTPHIHLVAVMDVAAGEQLLGVYSDVECVSDPGKDFWQYRWGFVPPHDMGTLSRSDLLQMLGS